MTDWVSKANDVDMTDWVSKANDGDMTDWVSKIPAQCQTWVGPRDVERDDTAHPVELKKAGQA